jgi:hypothetical protein
LREEAVLMCEEKASDERRRMQRQTELAAAIRALERTLGGGGEHLAAAGALSLHNQ